MGFKPMNDDEEAKQGRPDARTPPHPAPELDIATAVAALGNMIESGDADQADLLLGSPDLDNIDAISMAANLSARPRRERGRPKGASNLRNTKVFDYLEALGHRDPAVTLSMIQSANTTALAAVLGCDPIDVLKVQAKAASDLMPFKYAKRPLAVDVTKTERHIFYAASLADHPTIEGDTGLSIFGGQVVEDIEGNQ